MAGTSPTQNSDDIASELAAALDQVDWTTSFSANAMRRGEQLHEADAVDIERMKRAQRSGVVEVQARVSSQRGKFTRYRTHVRIRTQAPISIACDCSCPVGIACKHAVAVILTLQQQAGDAREDWSAPALSNSSGPAGMDRAALIKLLEKQAAAHGLTLEQALLETGLDESVAAEHLPSDSRDSANLRAWDTWIKHFEQDSIVPLVAPRELRLRLRTERNRLLVDPLYRIIESGKSAPGFSRLPNLFNGDQSDPWQGFSERDSELLSQLLTNQRHQQYSEERVLIGAHGERTLQRLLARGSLLASGLAAREGEARMATLDWQTHDDGTQKLTVKLEPDASVFRVAGLWYLDPLSGEIGPITGIDHDRWERVRRAPPLRPGLRTIVGERIAALPAVPAPLETQEQPLDPLSGASLRVVAQSRPWASNAPTMYAGLLAFHYGTLRVEEEPATARVARTEGNVRLIGDRDSAGEERWQQKLTDAGLIALRHTQAQAQRHWMPLRQVPSAENWLELSENLRHAGLQIEFDRDFPLRLEAAPDEWYADLDEDQSSPWFDLELGIRIGDERVSLLPILLAALSSKFLSLKPPEGEREDATWLAPIDAVRRVPLPLAKVRALMAPILEWLERTEANGKLRLPKLRADVLEDYDQLAVQVNAAETLRRLANASKAATVNDVVPVPAGLRTSLRDYQHDGLNWLDFLARFQLGGVLADDMGLGKTVQVLAHVLSEKAQGRLSGPVLVVMPTSLVPNWRAEARRFAPELSVLSLHGSARQDDFPRIAEFDLVLTTYALLPRDFAVLGQIEFDLAIFDEAQAIKNPITKAAKSARELRAKRKLVMTGTPLENHLGELWAQVDLVLPGLLGERTQFTKHFRTPIEKHQDQEQLARLSRRLRPFLLRRTKQQVVLELPPKTEITQQIELEGPQREFYESLRLAMHKRVREAIKARGVAQSSIVVLDALLKLRQVCCDPALVKLPTGSKPRQSAKRIALSELLSTLLSEGRRVLLFSQFTEMLNLLEQDLRRDGVEFVRLDGSTRDRAEPVERFQGGTVPLMLISLKAGGVGLNLTAADTVIHYDPWWNPAVENQATDRAHRIGQDKPVFVYKLVCADTVEDKIVALQARKAELASAILDGGSSTRLQFDEQTIDELFGEG